MAVENIQVEITADDSGFLESIEEMNSEALELDATAKDLNKSLDKAFQPRKVQGFQGALKGTTTELNKQDVQVKKNTKSFSGFNKAGGRGISMLSRFTGVGGRATRSLGGLAVALGGSPFGAFALAASAATLAYSFFSETLTGSNDEIIKKNQELEDSILSLSSSLRTGFQQGKLIAIDLEVLQGLSEAEASLKRISVFNQNIGAARAALNKDNNEASRLEVALANGTLKTKTEELEAEKRLKEIDLERLKIANEISANESRILKEQLKQEQAAKRSSEERRKRAIETDKLFDRFITDDLQRRLKAIDRAAEAERVSAEKTIKRGFLLDSFIKKSQDKQIKDKEALEKQFTDATLKARKALQTQLIIDEEAASIAAAQKAADDRATQIESVIKDEQEKAKLTKLNEEKLQSDISAIQSKFADQRKQEGIKKEQELFSLRSASFEAQALEEKTLFDNELLLERQAFEATKRTEEELTAFNKRQNEEKLKLELGFQIKRLELARQYNKELTKEETAALNAQIALLKTRLSGVGSEIAGEAKTDVKNGSGLFGLLGISEGTQQDVEAVQGAISQVTQAVSDAVAERVALLDAEVQKRNERINELQSNLNTEIELNKLGKASNIEAVQDQLRQEKAARDKAEKEKEEAAKAQFAIDTALQASNLITAISGLYSSLSGLPFGIGVALATALSGVLVGSFVASKVTAANAAGFADGGYTGEGGKYEVAGPVHKGEYVFDQGLTNKLNLKNVPHERVEEVLADHFSDNIPDHRNVKRVNKRINESKSYIESNKKAERYKAIKEGFREEFKEQNKLLVKINTSLENMPVTTQIADGVFRIQKGSKIETFRVQK